MFQAAVTGTATKGTMVARRAARPIARRTSCFSTMFVAETFNL